MAFIENVFPCLLKLNKKVKVKHSKSIGFYINVKEMIGKVSKEDKS